ncbi:hypothetical protein TEA_015420 [Camellia sinensis var. sinensis]|uniref:Peptidase C19 ubiquitin carboxyl-terminal hydrolase domain-containing protein n=1 Tax=Camellia sinensis var. sinensis TaxID=542762 RepID=A0A4V3WME5_CAMSN|nr:hypothetical protein TEA_015420 [Camellia sinensis var. sinensis]
MRSNVADASSESSPSSSSSWEEGDSALAEIRECPFCILEKRIARSLSVDLTLDTPAKMNSCLRIFAEHFRFGRQEDAHEFLRYVIDACHNTCLRLKKLQQRWMKLGFGSDSDSGSGKIRSRILQNYRMSERGLQRWSWKRKKKERRWIAAARWLHAGGYGKGRSRKGMASLLESG